tara:strand:+ start:505 stop:648 length:144 start_codon:yes stop_codon:yes gene_type:complete
MLEALEEQERLTCQEQGAKIPEAAQEEQVKTFMRVMLVVLKTAALEL